MKGLAKLIYDENGTLLKIIDDRGRELVAEFNWVEPTATGTAEPTKLERVRPAKPPE